MTTDTIFETLVPIFSDLKTKWDSYITDTYENNSYKTDRLDYVDIGEISRFIVNKFKRQETKDFGAFFEKVEMLLDEGDDKIDNLIIVGLLEGIQNNCGHENLDYHGGFNSWLKPLTKKAWDDLIFSWEG